MTLVNIWTSLIFLGEQLTCHKHSSGHTIRQNIDEEGCLQRCNTLAACKFVTHTNNFCYTWQDCFPIPGDTELFQHPRACTRNEDLIAGNGIQLLSSSNISGTPRAASYHLQLPEDYSIISLGFPNPRPDDCANFNPVGECTALNGGWREMQVGCIRILEGVFPVTEYYDVSNGINRMDWIVEGTELSTSLEYSLEFRFPPNYNSLLGENATGSLNLRSPWSMQLSTTLEITLNLVVEVAFKQSFSGFEGESCSSATLLVEEATWQSLAGFSNPRDVKVSTDCDMWDLATRRRLVGENSATRRRLIEVEFNTEVLLPSGETLEFSPSIWEELMDFYLEEASLTEVTTPVCVGCDELLPMVVLDDQDVESDFNRLSTNITIRATSTAAEGWRIDGFGSFAVTSEQTSILASHFMMGDVDTECGAMDSGCTQSWTVGIDVDAISGTDGIYKLTFPMIQTQDPFNTSTAEYTLIVGDPQIEVDEVGEYFLEVKGISEFYASSQLPALEFYINDIVEYSFNTSIEDDEFVGITVLNMSVIWEATSFSVIPVDFETSSFTSIIKDITFEDGDVKWIVRLEPHYFTHNGTFNLVIEGFIDTDVHRFGFHHDVSIFLHDLVCLDPHSRDVPIQVNEYHQINCPGDANGGHFMKCGPLGWDVPNSHPYCDDAVIVEDKENVDTQLTWLSIMIIALCVSTFLVVIGLFAINYKRCRDLPAKRTPEKRVNQINIEMSPNNNSRNSSRRIPYGASKKRTDSTASNPESRMKRIPRWRKETDKSDKKKRLSNIIAKMPQSRLPEKSNEFHISPSSSPLTRRKRQMFRLIAAIESKLAKSNVPLTPIEKVEIKLSRPRGNYEDSRSRSMSAGTNKRCFRQRSPSVSDSSPPTSLEAKPWTQAPQTRPRITSANGDTLPDDGPNHARKKKPPFFGRQRQLLQRVLRGYQFEKKQNSQFERHKEDPGNHCR